MIYSATGAAPEAMTPESLTPWALQQDWSGWTVEERDYALAHGYEESAKRRDAQIAQAQKTALLTMGAVAVGASVLSMAGVYFFWKSTR